jgi:TRAP-type C4-dicarboxylate transport system permease small subunit
MLEPTDQPLPEAPRPRTATVIGLLAGVAGVFSFLLAYAMTGVLVATDILKPFPPDRDPRPIYFVVCFAGLMIVLLVLATLLRALSRKHLREIEAMEDEEPA